MVDAEIAPSPASNVVEGELSSARWGLLRRVWFRFLCCYFILYSLPETGRISIVHGVPGVGLLFQPYVALWHIICPWVAIHVFGLSGRVTTYFPTGSGDTTLGYIQNLLFVVFSLAATLIWSVLDYKRPDYHRLQSWLRLLVRYTLVVTLFGYGFAKLFPLQFQPPSFEKLIQPYGEFSPMGVLWNFMGASLPYTMFSGTAEVIGGLFLIFRRTTTLGALIAFGVMLHVAVLNFCYDVPVKLYSTNLVLMCVYLVASDCRRLANVLLLNRAAAPADLAAPRFERRWARNTVTACWLLFVGFNLLLHIAMGLWEYNQIYVHPSRPPLYGLYEVETFTRNGQELPPLLTNSTRWRKVAMTWPEYLSVRMMDDSVSGYGAAYDTIKNTLTLKDKDVLAWSRPDSEHLVLDGKLGSDAVVMRLKKVDTSKFLLTSRGFHWINEMPFNR
jgi:uncharacterized membrane protein YphA (DoxX/SURF4 family)